MDEILIMLGELASIVVNFTGDDEQEEELGINNDYGIVNYILIHYMFTLCDCILEARILITVGNGQMSIPLLNRVLLEILALFKKIEILKRDERIKLAKSIQLNGFRTFRAYIYKNKTKAYKLDSINQLLKKYDSGFDIMYDYYSQFTHASFGHMWKLEFSGEDKNMDEFLEEGILKDAAWLCGLALRLLDEYSELVIPKNQSFVFKLKNLLEHLENRYDELGIENLKKEFDKSLVAIGNKRLNKIA